MTRVNGSNIFETIVVKDKPRESYKHNGHVLLEDTIVAEVVDGKINIVNPDLCPIRFFRDKSFSSWCKTRAMDLSRTNSRLLRKALKLNTTNSVEIAKKAYCSVITDRYWFRELGDNITYKDIRYRSDILADLALFGKLPRTVNLNTPELTNTGSFEKCWKIHNGRWFLYKLADDEKKFSELFIHNLGIFFGFKMAHYEVDNYVDNIILSEDFTESGKFTFEPFESFTGIDANISTSLEVLKKLGYDFVQDYLNMIFLDVICFNEDRHTFNYGILRDLQTGEAISLAPNYDNNLALTAMGKLPGVIIPSGYESEFISNAFKYRYEFPYLTCELIESIVTDTADECSYKGDINYVIEFVWNNYSRVVESYEQYKLDNEG